jgi:hypothetical protein
VSKSAKPHAARLSGLFPAAAVGAAVLLAASVVACGSESASTSPYGALQPSASPTAAPTEIPTLGTASLPLNPTGWPISVRADVMGQIVVGPDGTIYTSGLVPADKAGMGRVGWLVLPDGSYLVPGAFGPDGSAFGELDGMLWAFGPDGKARPGWPVDVGASGWALSPGGSVYLMQWPTEGSTSVTILDDNATAVSTWSVPKVLDYSCDYLIQQDGTFWLTYPVPDESWWPACEIHAFGTDGRELSKGVSGERWTGMDTGPSGAVVAWYYEFAEGSQDRPARTRVAVLGLDGRPVAGWPVTLEGSASPPAFGPDGALYFTLMGGSENTVVALDAAGKSVPGWPVRLTAEPLTVAAADAEPLRPQPPVVGDGVVYVAGLSRVEAFDAAGKVPQGWPYTLPAAWDDSRCTTTAESPVWNTGPIHSTGGSGPGRLYLGLEDRIVALTPDGADATGWPYRAGSDFVCWRQFDQAPDGGLIATAYYRTAAGPEHRIVRLTPEGEPPQ